MQQATQDKHNITENMTEHSACEVGAGRDRITLNHTLAKLKEEVIYTL